MAQMFHVMNQCPDCRCLCIEAVQHAGEQAFLPIHPVVVEEKVDGNTGYFVLARDNVLIGILKRDAF